MTPLSLCFVSPHARGALESCYGLPSTSGFGGAEVQTVLIGSSLAERGHGVTFVCRGESPQVEERSIGPIRMLTVPARRRDGSHRLRPIQSILKTLRRADCGIYYQRCAQPITGMVARHCRQQHRKFVFAVANDRDLDGRARQALGFWRYSLFRYGFKRADRIIVQSRAQLSLVPPVVSHRAVLIPSALNIESIVPRPDPSTRRVLWVGTLLPKKRPMELLRLVKELPGVNFVAVAQPATDAELANAFKREARLLGNLELHARVEHRQMEQFYARASLLLNTSEAEGVPNTFLEAWSREIPVASLGIDPDRLLSKLGLGRVFTATNLAGQLRDYLEDDEARIRHGKAGRQYVWTHHVLAQVTDKYENLFRELAS